MIATKHLPKQRTTSRLILTSVSGVKQPLSRGVYSTRGREVNGGEGVSGRYEPPVADTVPNPLRIAGESRFRHWGHAHSP